MQDSREEVCEWGREGVVCESLFWQIGNVKSFFFRSLELAQAREVLTTCRSVLED